MTIDGGRGSAWIGSHAILVRMGADDRVYIGFVDISPAIAEKIQTKHGVTPDDVRDACAGYAEARWHVHDEHGRRLLVRGVTRGGVRLKVILQPVDVTDGTWRLRTAFADTGGV